MITVTLHSAGQVYETITNNMGQINSGKIDARGNRLSAISVTELLCSQICGSQLVMS